MEFEFEKNNNADSTSGNFEMRNNYLQRLRNMVEALRVESVVNNLANNEGVLIEQDRVVNIGDNCRYRTVSNPNGCSIHIVQGLTRKDSLQGVLSIAD